MSKMVHCKKLGIEAEGFTAPPYPGAMGQRIVNEISKQAFEMWKNQQIMLINEYRLNLADPEARKFLTQEMEKFLFQDINVKPAGYVPPEKTAE